MKAIRLDKYLAEMGKGTRSQIKQDLKKGLVKVNGVTVKTPEQKVDPETDTVTYGGETVSFVAFEYYMLNKPAGCVSATEDKREQTVIDLITEHSRKDLFPVGRLDKDTEGLLLITNDGDLAHRLLHPTKHVDKTYFARIEGTATEAMAQAFMDGLDIGDAKPTLPAKLKILTAGDVSEVEITIREGRFHQVKRMVEAVGSQVLYLKRLTMGSLTLDPMLEPGDYRPLTEKEKAVLGVIVKER